jgi:hypothetical protein
LIGLCGTLFWISVLWGGSGGAQTFFTKAIDLPFAARSTTVGDYDNDGWPDIFAAQSLFTGRHQTALLHNDGGGRFSDRRAAIQAVIDPYPKGGGMIFGDYDNAGGTGVVQYRSLLLLNMGEDSSWTIRKMQG